MSIKKQLRYRSHQELYDKNNERYYVKVKQSGGSFHISEGGKPFFRNEGSYHSSLTVTTTEGNITCDELKGIVNYTSTS